MEDRRRQPSSVVSIGTCPSIESDNRQQTPSESNGSDRGDILIEIPLALLDIFERDTVLPLSRVRTNQSAAAIRITRPFLSPFASGINIVAYELGWYLIANARAL